MGSAKAPKTPKAPDYVGAAQQQGHINNPNINGIGGSQSVTWNGNDPTITQSLSPEQQQLYNQRTQQQQGIGNIGLMNLGNLEDTYSQGFNEDGSLDRQRVEDSMYGRATSRLDPQFQRQEDQLRTRLTNQGLNQNDEAWKNEFSDFNNSRNDAYAGARNQAISQGGTAQQQALANALQMRQQPLQEQSQLMGLSQGQMPQFQQYNPADYAGAIAAKGNYAADLYNAQAASAGNTQSGLFGLGSAGIGALGNYFSDRRLKTDIYEVGKFDNGFTKYAYRYIWDVPGTLRIGVMADEVEKIMPQAVTEENGFKKVNYSKVFS